MKKVISKDQNPNQVCQACKVEFNRKVDCLGYGLPKAANSWQPSFHAELILIKNMRDNHVREKT